MSGIYIHIPFCKQACHYCNFHFSTSLKYKDEMVNAIIKEIEIRNGYLDDKNIESIYFGGGTPSLLDHDDIDRMVEKINSIFTVNKNAEITLEANPDDLTIYKLKELSHGPVNRLSIGVQSFFEDELKWMNRAHNASEAESCIKEALDQGFDNISMDLIFGIPLSNSSRWEKNLKKTVDFDIPHISAYALTVESGTALNHFVKVGKVTEASDEFVMEQFDFAVGYLKDFGYTHYEISNYAKPGKFAVHNTNYWKSVPYLGLGPSAHSFNGFSRTSNIANNALFMKGIRANVPNIEIDQIDDKTSYNEFVMTRIRTIWGIQIKEIESFHKKFAGFFNSKAEVLLKKDWLRFENDTYTLTSKGKHFADAVTVELFVE